MFSPARLLALSASYSPRLFAIADQGFQGLANIAAMALLGRVLPMDAFGAVGMTIGIYFFVAGFHRSAVVLPYITEHRPPTITPELRRYHSDWWWLSLGASLALATALLIPAALLYLLSGRYVWVIEPLLLGATITPSMLAVEFARRWFYKIERADLAAFTSLVFFAVLIVAVALLERVRLDATSGALAWLIAASVATMVALVRLRPLRPHFGASLRRLTLHKKFATWLSLNIFPYTIYSSATVVIIIGALMGPIAAAIFTAARTLTNPAVSIVSAIDSTDKPRAARALAEEGVPGLKRAIGGTRWLLIALTGGYLGLIALAAGPILHFAFHGQYPGIELEVRLLCAAFFLFCLNQPSETVLIVLRASETMFVTRSATAIATIVAILFARPYGVAGMACAIGVSQLFNLGILYLAERKVAARYEAAA